MLGFRLTPNRIFIGGLVALSSAIVAVALLVGGTSGTRAGEPGDLSRIEQFLQSELDASNIPGAALAVVDSNGEIQALGLGDDGRGTDVSGDTPFWIGSNTKSITALATMQLSEVGQIDLDAPVRTYLPSFAVSDAVASRQITVRHLLNQTSGFSRTDGVEVYLEQRDETLQESVAALANVSLNRPVGESFEYSNLNFVVLGLVIEEVSGLPWASYVEERIFEPLGMTRSFTSLEEAKAAGLTETHRFMFGYPVASEPKYLEGLAPSGWLYSTANDMARYAAMYLNGGELDGVRVLSEAGINEMLTGATNTVTRQLQSHQFTYEYGAGWFVGQFGGADDARWHLGNLPEFTSWMVLLPETNEAVVLFVNAGSQAEFAGGNSVMSRMPIGTVNLLRGEDAAGGTSTSQFYAIFNVVVLAVVAIQVWSLLRLVRRTTRPSSTYEWGAAVLPFAWEFAFAGFVTWTVARMPGGWSGTFLSLPDFTLVAAIVAGTWIATGLTRTAWLGRVVLRREPSDVSNPSPQPVAGRPTPR